MTIRKSAAAVAMLCLLAPVGSSLAADDATLLRVFLSDGTSLVSYGEFARVGDRVIFSLPTSTSTNPALQLVNLPADRVNWEKTNKYADAARAAHYEATQAEPDYLVLSNTITKALNEVAFETEPAKRLAIVETARKMLAEWPQHHFNYRLNDVRQMLGLLDEAIADLRAAAASGSRFDLSLVAVNPPPPSTEPLLPPPTPVESVEQLLAASSQSDSPEDQRKLLSTALLKLTRDSATLPKAWVATTSAKVRGALDANVRVDQSYQAMIRRAIAQAEAAARRGDTRGIARVLESLRSADRTLGGKRPDAIAAAIAAIEAQLDSARRLNEARERWTARAPVLRGYSTAMSATLRTLRGLEPPLQDIKELAGSSRATLAFVERQAAGALKAMESIDPPEECRAAHALLVSSAHLANNAARIRRDATLAGDIARAWDASSAAAGALMLEAKATGEIQTLVSRPQPQ